MHPNRFVALTAARVTDSVTLAAARVNVSETFTLAAARVRCQMKWPGLECTTRVSEFWPFHLTSTVLGPNGHVRPELGTTARPPEFWAADMFRLSLGRVI